MYDIYFDPKYGKLYEEIEQGKSIVYKYESTHGKIQHMFIKREITNDFEGESYFDIVTPYGYGGPLIVESENKEQLVNEFEKDFQQYCLENNIVSEFVRFHPILGNGIDFKLLYNSENIRNTVGTNLQNYNDPFAEEFSKSCRKNIRKSLKNGVTYQIIEKPKNISRFLEIYYSTMYRNKAQDYYYFDEKYFNQCIDLFQENVLIVEAIYQDKIIAMGFYFIYDQFIHTHLSGTLTEYLYLSPAYILRYALTEWGKENGYQLIHHGGGTSNSADDSLYKFKKQFGKNTEFPYYIGKKIWNEKIYNQLCLENNIDKNIEFFPAYRYKK